MRCYTTAPCCRASAKGTTWHRSPSRQGNKWLPRRSKKRRGASGIIKTVHRAHSGKDLPRPGRRKIAERDGRNREQNRTTSGESARMSVSSTRGRVAKLNIAFFVRASRPVWLNAHCTAAAHIKFGCICIILAILCWVTKSTGRDSLKIFLARCCTHGSWVFVTRAPANGKVLKLRC